MIIQERSVVMRGDSMRGRLNSFVIRSLSLILITSIWIILGYCYILHVRSIRWESHESKSAHLPKGYSAGLWHIEIDLILSRY